MIVNRRLRRIGLAAVSGMLMLSLSSFMPAKNEFTAAEQQQVSIATPGLFAQSQAFNVDFEIFRAKEYSFPLPVGKASLINGNSVMRISTAKGDAVKAMFDGNNAENLVKVGQSIDAGQTIAIVGTREGETYCDFSIMVNGARINPETIIELKSHKLRRQTVQFRKEGNRIGIKVIGGKDSSVSKNDRNNKETNKKSGSSRSDHAMTLDPDEVYDPFTITNTFRLDLEKTKPNDEIYAAFDGVVVASGPYYGYGNCIRIKHAYGLETLYSHQSKNMVKKGDKVKAGQVIGLTGRTGRATTEHLHFEVSFGGKRLDPAIIFDHSNHKLKAATLHLTKGKGVKSVKN